MPQAEPKAEKRFDVIFECEGVNAGGLRNDLAVRMIEPEPMEFTLATDEGAFHGGGGTAPVPLALFAGGLAGCIMTQIRAFSKRLGIPVTTIKLRCRLHWEGRQRGRDPYVSDPVGFSIDIDLDGDASDEDRARLIEAAKNGCFIERTSMRPNAVAHRLRTQRGWMEL